jgi:hypothetical protein
MIVKRLIAAGIVLWLGVSLASCGPSFGGYFADRLPHWAGGLPPDAPPRPGTPGYDEFIAHGEPASNTATPASAATTGAAPGATPASGAATTSTSQGKAQNGKVQVGSVQSAPAPAGVQNERAEGEAPAPAEPSENPSAEEDTSVVKGGLY